MDSQPKTLRIGIVGAGANTRAKHIPLLKKIQGVELIAVNNRTQSSAEAVAKEFGIARVEDSWRAIVNASDIDAVVIGTWPNLHAEITCAALATGKHVLSEARMARTLGEAEWMLKEATLRPTLVTQIVPAPFSLDFDSTIAELLPQLGELREIKFTHIGGQFADGAAPLSWRQDIELSGFNTLTLGIGYETLLRWLQHDPQWVSADAAVFTEKRANPMTGHDGHVVIPESLDVWGRYSDGARLSIHLSGVDRGEPQFEFRLNGAAASLRIDAARGKLFFARNGAREEEVVVAPEKRRGWRVEEDFVRSIREKSPVELTSFQTGVRYMRFTEAVWRSWQNLGTRITLLA